jgi:hypothetical protein
MGAPAPTFLTGVTMVSVFGGAHILVLLGLLVVVAAVIVGVVFLVRRAGSR